MVPASSWIAIVVLAGVALQAVIGLVFVYRQRQHPVIAWRHPIRMAFRTLVLLLWSATNVVGPQSSDSTICSIRVVNAILLWTLLGSVLSQLWFLYVSWSCIAVALADNTVNQVNSKSTLIRYRQVLTSRPLLTTLEVLVIVIGSIPVVSATAASGLTPRSGIGVHCEVAVDGMVLKPCYAQRDLDESMPRQARDCCRRHTNHLWRQPGLLHAQPA